ncbi:DUF1642 domain-containing protein [Listeria monocytogenes]|nr:DUF1642 domain-containing protein [Listeria monocytogenes]
MKNFEVGERVQFIYEGKLRTGIIEKLDGELVDIPLDGGTLYTRTDEIAKLDQPKPEKLPKEVVDVIGGYEDTYKDPRDRLIILKNIVAYMANFHTGNIKADNWIQDNKRRFIRAVLNGYVVEEEQKYYVKLLPNDCGFLNYSKITDWYSISSKSEIDHFQTKFTEKEIKSINERYWAFAVPVEEVEAE